MPSGCNTAFCGNPPAGQHDCLWRRFAADEIHRHACSQIKKKAGAFLHRLSLNESREVMCYGFFFFSFTFVATPPIMPFN